MKRGQPSVRSFGKRLTIAGVVLSVTGFMIVMAGMIIDSLSGGGGGTASFIGIIVIGPIPIAFGTDRTTLLIGVIGAITLMIIASAILYVGARRATSQAGNALSRVSQVMSSPCRQKRCQIADPLPALSAAFNRD